MISREKAYALRALIEKASASLTDEEALTGVELFPHWDSSASYNIDDRVSYNGVLYRCLINHSAQSDWNPLDSVSLWAEVLIPNPEIIPDWVQPESTNAYMMGDKVRHNNKIWISIQDYNVFEPGIAGWNEVT